MQTIRHRKLRLNEISFSSEDALKSPLFGKLAERLGQDVVHLVILAHPPILKEAVQGQYLPVAGQAQLLVAKSVLPPDELIQVVLVSEDFDHQTMQAIEDLVVPLLFDCPTGVLKAKIKEHLRNKSTQKLGRDLISMRNWNQLIQTARGRKKNSKKNLS